METDKHVRSGMGHADGKASNHRVPRNFQGLTKVNRIPGEDTNRGLPHLVPGESLGGRRVVHLVQVRSTVELRAGDGHLSSTGIEDTESDTKLSRPNHPHRRCQRGN